MDAQQMHDEAVKGRKLSPGSRERLEDLLAKKSAASSGQGQSKPSDPLGAMLRDNPSLTKEKALQLIEDSGF